MTRKFLLSLVASCWLLVAAHAQNKIDLSRQTKGGPLPAGSLPASSASNFGGVKDLDCTGVGHVLKLASGVLTCSADSGGGGGGTVTHTAGPLNSAAPVVGNVGGDIQTLNNYTVVDNSTAARTFNLPDANGSLVQLVPLTAHQWVNQINAQGAGGTSRPDCGDLTSFDLLTCTFTSPVAGQVLGFSDSLHIVNSFISSPPDAIITTTTYTFVTGDRNHLKVFNPAGSCALTLPAASGAGFTGKWSVIVQNISAVDCVITPITSTIGPSAAPNVTVKPGHWAIVRGNDTDYPGFSQSPGQLLAGTGVTLTPSALGLTIALGTPTSSTLGGIESFAAVSHQWINAISTAGVPTATQPAFTDISGSIALAQTVLTTLGDIGYVNATPALARLPGNTAATKQFLSQTGTGSLSAAPAWGLLASGDIPNNAANTTGTSSNITGIAAIVNGGTNTSSTLTGLVRGGAAYTASELSGDATTSGSNAVSVVKVNGGSLPTSSFLVGTNGSNQIIAAQPFVTNAQTSTYQVVSADFVGCKTIPVASGTFTITLVASGSQPASGQCIDIVNYGSGTVTVARSGQNINGAAANLTISPGSAPAPNGLHVVSNGTDYVAQPLLGSAGGSGTVTSVATTAPITGGTFTTSGTIACATCTTNAAALTSGQLMTGAGGQASQVGNLSGDVTTAGTTATTVVRVNGATVPLSAVVLGSNASNQLIAALLQGNGTKVQLSTGGTTVNDLAKYDANGNVVDSFSPLGPINVNGSQISAPNLVNQQFLGSNIFQSLAPPFVVCFGDSLAAGTTGVTGTNQDWCDQLQLLNSGGETNNGNSGDMAPDMVRNKIIPATPVVVKPAAPTLATSTSGGSLPATTTEFVKVWFITALGTTDGSTESSIATGAGATNTVTITSPVPSNGQSGWIKGYSCALGATSGSELTNSTCINVPIGTNTTLGVVGAGAAVPGTNTGYISNGNVPFLYTSQIGTNDANQYGATASLQTVFQQTHLAGIAWLTATNMVFAQNSACTPTGSWSVDNTALTGLGEKTTTNNDTMACSVIIGRAGVLYVWYRIINSDGGTFTVKDGSTLLTDSVTNASTLNGFPGASMTTLNGATDSFALARFTGLTQGSHTINFTATSATNASNVVSIAALGSTPTLAFATPPRVAVLGVIKQSPDIGITATYDTLVQNDINLLKVDGLNTIFVNVRTDDNGNNLLDPTQDFFNTLHPNNSGQQKILARIAAAMAIPNNGYNYQISFGQLTPYLIPDAFIYRQNPKELSIGSSTRGDKSGTLDVAALNIYNGATLEGIFSNGGFTQSSSGYVGFSSSSTAATPVVAKITGNGSTNVFNFGSGSGGVTGILNFTTGNISGGLNLGSTPPACTLGTAGAFCASEGSAFTNVASTAGMYPDSTSHEWVAKTNGSASGGILVRTQPGTINQVTQTAAITTATLCAASAGACNVAGQYHIHWNFWGSGTACSSVTAGSVTFLLTWTDENSITHTAVAEEMIAQTGAATTAMQTTFPFQTALANESGSGDATISTNGSVIQYATGYTACTTGTGTYNLRASVDRIQ